MSNARHTPETDAFANEIAPESTLKAICADWYEHACKLEQQRDAALERERVLRAALVPFAALMGVADNVHPKGSYQIVLMTDSRTHEVVKITYDNIKRASDALAAKGEK